MDTLPPQFIEIVEAVRELYVGQFADTVAGFSEETHVVEPVLLDAAGDVATEGPMRLPFRADYASLETGRLESFAAPREIRFEPFSFMVGGAEIVVAPFAWDYATVRVSGDWDALSKRLFADWHRRAFGDEDAEDSVSLHNVIHTATTPEVTDTGYAFEADFGTAPASTMSDLLLALLANAPQRIEIGMADEPSA
ncbi:hypothetical protein [Oricola sp.]|uniref:hypothetical protein n=1 Tax=Oricola sp. TaxID=1979950 RepID=UPI0025D962D1|nr:hypothetical protein [Oricola sp.]MCI5074330.1 hypothetical protein [Oricola sp.]